MRALPAADAVIDPARDEGSGGAIGFIARVESVSCQLHHWRRAHEPLAVRGTGRYAQHAFDAVHGVGRCREFGPGNGFGKAAIGPLALYPGLD